MPKTAKPRLSAPERRALLIDAAITVLAQKGYDGASVEEIAGVAAVTKPVLYDHFPSKEGLFVAAIEQIRDGLLQRGRDAVAREKTPGKQLKAAIATFFDLVEQDPRAARVLLISSKSPAPIAEVCHQVQEEATRGIATILRSHAAHAPHGSAASDRHWFLKAEFTKKGMHGLAEWWLDHPRVPRSEIEGPLLEILKHGVGL